MEQSHNFYNCIPYLSWEIFPGVYNRFAIHKTIKIGRDTTNDIVLTDASISSHHAQITRENDKVWIEDMGSTNGSLVNDTPIERSVLKHGDSIQVGYTKMIFSSEKQNSHIITLSSDKSNLDIEKDITSNEDISFVFPSDDSCIQNVIRMLEKKLQTLSMPKKAEKRFIVSVTEAIWNGYIHGNQKDNHKTLCCRYQNLENEIKITVTDQGHGFQYRDWFQKHALAQDHLPDKGLFLLLQGTDYIEYNDTGNQIILTRKLSRVMKETKEATPLQEERFLSVRYSTMIGEKKSFCMEVLLSSESLKTFPDNLDVPAYDQNVAMGNNHSLYRITPICPGSLCSPSYIDVDMIPKAVKLQFWITPFVGSKTEKSSLLVTRQGRIVKSILVPFNVSNTTMAKFLLWTSLLLPILSILMDIPSWNIKADVPKIVENIITLVRILGGTTICGLLIGCVCFILGLFFYLRPCKSRIIQEKIVVTNC